MQLAATPYLDSLVWIPYGYFAKGELDVLKKRLTVVPKRFNLNAPPPEPIKMYVEDNERQVFGMPIDFGLKYLPNGDMDVEDKTIIGYQFEPRRLPDPNHPNASPGQAEFMHDMYHAAQESYAFLAEAPTGVGKTVVALNTIGLIKRTALIICGSRRLAQQWRREAILHLGLNENEVGLIQEGKADWEDKVIVSAVVHNLADQQWPAELYRHFGIVVWDEGHRLGARMFARTLTQFYARHKWAMTATPYRRDNCEKLFLDYFGSPTVNGVSTALPMDAYVLQYRRRGKAFSSTIPLAILINLLAKDDERNRLIAHATRTMFEKGRHTLVVSDRVVHLQRLRELCIQEGIPESMCGLFTRSYVDDNGRSRTHTEEELDNVMHNAQVIFATYGMFKEGIDIPRLDAGIDATPRAEGTQMIGRVRRPVPGKRRPVWFTIRDLGVPQLIRQCKSRLRDYRESGVTIYDGNSPKGGHNGKTQIG